jgi:dipeptidyl aminopeptidase/acylaminoacyl peptidase
VTKEQDQLDELWVYDAFSSRVHQASMIDPARLAANLGESRRIRWTRQDGRELSGALLLPTGYRTGTRVPLVTWVYGGANSAARNWFSLSGSGAMLSMHILATRGFAVFFPMPPTGPANSRTTSLHLSSQASMRSSSRAWRIRSASP